MSLSLFICVFSLQQVGPGESDGEQRDRNHFVSGLFWFSEVVHPIQDWWGQNQLLVHASYCSVVMNRKWVTLHHPSISSQPTDYHYDKYYRSFFVWLNRDLLNAREICVNWSRFMSHFLGCCVWVNVVNYWGSADKQLSFSDSVTFVPISLPCVSALGSRLELPLLTDQSLIQSWLFPASLEKKRAANHLPPALIASWLHSLFCLKV